MHADQDAHHPWLREETLWLQQLLVRHTPVLGVCLGVQLLARAAGAWVGRMPDGPEIGWYTVELTDEGAADPVVGALPATLRRDAVASLHVRLAGRRGRARAQRRLHAGVPPRRRLLGRAVPSRGHRSAGRGLGGGCGRPAARTRAPARGDAREHRPLERARALALRGVSGNGERSASGGLAGSSSSARAEARGTGSTRARSRRSCARRSRRCATRASRARSASPSGSTRRPRLLRARRRARGSSRAGAAGPARRRARRPRRASRPGCVPAAGRTGCRACPCTPLRAGRRAA